MRSVVSVTTSSLHPARYVYVSLWPSGYLENSVGANDLQLSLKSSQRHHARTHTLTHTQTLSHTQLDHSAAGSGLKDSKWTPCLKWDPLSAYQ